MNPDEARKMPMRELTAIVAELQYKTRNADPSKEIKLRPLRVDLEINNGFIWFFIGAVAGIVSTIIITNGICK